MTDTPATADDLLELWAGTVGPAEPSPTIHPSMLPALPRTIRVIGSPWEAHEHPDGRWDFRANGEVIWGPMTGTVEDAFRLLLDVHRDPTPRAESQGHPVRRVTDPLRTARGICTGVAVGAAMWALMFAVGYTIARLAGWSL